MTGTRDWHAILIDLSTLLRERYGIAHVTLQPEQADALPEVFRGCTFDTPEGVAACLDATAGVPVEHGHRH